MTKTLTEQWREGTLPAGFYYLEMNDGLVIIDHTIYVVGEKIYRWELSSVDYVKEVLAPVPNYDEWQAELASNDELLTVQKRLEKQLAIATKALEEFKKTEDNYLDFGLTSSWKEVKLNPNRVATKALKEMEGVK